LVAGVEARINHAQSRPPLRPFGCPSRPEPRPAYEPS
jgi:hypothetical protein